MIRQPSERRLRGVADRLPIPQVHHSRSLPLAGSAPEPDPSSTAAASTSPAAQALLEGRVEVFDPAMCCPTGLCGPGADPAPLPRLREPGYTKMLLVTLAARAWLVPWQAVRARGGPGVGLARHYQARPHVMTGRA